MFAMIMKRENVISRWKLSATRFYDEWQSLEVHVPGQTYDIYVDSGEASIAGRRTLKLQCASRGSTKQAPSSNPAVFLRLYRQPQSGP